MMLAHDVRSPLTAVRGSLQLLHDRASTLSPSTTRELSDLALRQTDRTLMLARDLLDLARSESGRLELTTTSVAIADVVRRAVDLLPQDANRVTVDVPGDLVVVADEHRLEQIVFNLLTNALHHGRPPVVVSAADGGGMVALWVRDHGQGVDDAVLEGLFEPFSPHAEGGAGLGIWVVRALVEAHGGHVAYADADPGAVFEVTLPTVPATPSVDDPASADQVPG
jgi:signal transduction histidine kinase